MENFATLNQENLIKELREYKLTEERRLGDKIGITKQFIRDNINGINLTIKVIKESLDKLRLIP